MHTCLLHSYLCDQYALQKQKFSLILAFMLSLYQHYMLMLFQRQLYNVGKPGVGVQMCLHVDDKEYCCFVLFQTCGLCWQVFINAAVTQSIVEFSESQQSYHITRQHSAVQCDTQIVMKVLLCWRLWESAADKRQAMRPSATGKFLKWPMKWKRFDSTALNSKFFKYRFISRMRMGQFRSINQSINHQWNQWIIEKTKMHNALSCLYLYAEYIHANYIMYHNFYAHKASKYHNF